MILNDSSETNDSSGGPSSTTIVELGPPNRNPPSQGTFRNSRFRCISDQNDRSGVVKTRNQMILVSGARRFDPGIGRAQENAISGIPALHSAADFIIILFDFGSEKHIAFGDLRKTTLRST